MKKALEINVPQRIPHVSRFRFVLGPAMRRNVERRFAGRKMVRRGDPFSSCAEALKVYLEGSNAGVAARDGGDGGAMTAVCASSFAGRGGGASAYSDCF